MVMNNPLFTVFPTLMRVVNGSIRRKQSMEELLDQVEKHEGGCWYWLGRLTKDGYPMWRGRINYPGRYLYEDFTSKPFTKHQTLRRVCGNRRCVHPGHGVDLPRAVHLREVLGRRRFNAGQRNGRATITPDQVVIVKRLLGQGVRIKDICKDTGITRNIINQIRDGRSWKDV